MRVAHLRVGDYRRVRWKNGRGWTTELARAPADEGVDFDWRISIADIERDGAFSTFPQCDRLIALLDGNGMRLEFGDAPTVQLDQRLRFVVFSGDRATSGALLDGPVRDFNVIMRRGRIRAEAFARQLVGTMVFPAHADTTWFIYLSAGRARFNHAGNNAELNAGESLVLQADAMAGTCVLDGDGEVVAVKLIDLAPR